MCINQKCFFNEIIILRTSGQLLDVYVYIYEPLVSQLDYIIENFSSSEFQNFQIFL